MPEGAQSTKPGDTKKDEGQVKPDSAKLVERPAQVATGDEPQANQRPGNLGQALHLPGLLKAGGDRLTDTRSGQAIKSPESASSEPEPRAGRLPDKAAIRPQTRDTAERAPLSASGSGGGMGRGLGQG